MHQIGSNQGLLPKPISDLGRKSKEEQKKSEDSHHLVKKEERRQPSLGQMRVIEVQRDCHSIPVLK
jgi:hypothetical protein